MPAEVVPGAPLGDEIVLSQQAPHGVEVAAEQLEAHAWAFEHEAVALHPQLVGPLEQARSPPRCSRRSPRRARRASIERGLRTHGVSRFASDRGLRLGAHPPDALPVADQLLDLHRHRDGMHPVVRRQADVHVVDPASRAAGPRRSARGRARARPRTRSGSATSSGSETVSESSNARRDHSQRALVVALAKGHARPDGQRREAQIGVAGLLGDGARLVGLRRRSRPRARARSAPSRGSARRRASSSSARSIHSSIRSGSGV